jgi:uncharacterized membrane protein
MIVTWIDIVIDRPRAEVFAYLSDFEQNPTWQNGMKSCEWITEPPLRIGSRYRQAAGFAGREINSVFEVIELDSNRVKATSIEGTFPIIGPLRHLGPFPGGGSLERPKAFCGTAHRMPCLSGDI